MTVVCEQEQIFGNYSEAQNWLAQRGLYANLSLSDQADINSFLLTPDITEGTSPYMFLDPTVGAIANVTAAYHEGQFRKVNATHPYMKHVYMVTLQTGRLLPGGDLEPAMLQYAQAHGIRSLDFQETPGCALLHDVLECDLTIPRTAVYGSLVESGVNTNLAESITSLSQFMISPSKPPNLSPDQYLHYKRNDILRYYHPDVIRRLGVRRALTARAAKAADVLANGLEVRHDLSLNREGSKLANPGAFNASLETRLKLTRERLELFMQHDPFNPFLPDIVRLVGST